MVTTTTVFALTPGKFYWNDAFNADEMRYLRAKGLVINAETGEISLKGEQVQEAESDHQGVIAQPRRLRRHRN